jgi:hypothetical protein
MGCRWTTRQGLLHFQRPSWVCRTGSSSWRALQAHRRDPDSALEEFKKFDSIFLGAIGHPDVKPGILEVGILLKTRFALDQYINLRPVKLYPNVETPLKDKGPDTWTSWSCVKTPAASTPASAASRRRERRWK